MCVPTTGEAAHPLELQQSALADVGRNGCGHLFDDLVVDPSAVEHRGPPVLRA